MDSVEERVDRTGLEPAMTEDRIRDSQEYWEKHARRDPLWAILSDPSKKGRKWGTAEFFETGRREISILLYRLDGLRIPFGRRRALDFGCGVGRLTQALASRFEEVEGVDISETMIRLAGDFNRFPDRVRYRVNAESRLDMFPDASFDFVYTNIVLQHIQPDLCRSYLREFLRILRPDGLLVFQLPSHLRETAAVPRAVGPMADAAYAARIRLDGAPGSPLPPDTEIVLLARVRNAGPEDWVRDEAAPIRAGNHWLSSDGATMLVQDDGRALLPRTVAAGEECEVPLPVRTPGRPGHYLCEVDLVHESVSWFKDKGSPAVRFPVVIAEDGGMGGERKSGPPGVPDSRQDRPLPSPPPDAPARPEPQLLRWDEIEASSEAGDFPMHGIPKDELLDFLASEGASVVRIEEDEHGGPEWVGYRYFVRRRPAE